MFAVALLVAHKLRAGWRGWTGLALSSSPSRAAPCSPPRRARAAPTPPTRGSSRSPAPRTCWSRPPGPASTASTPRSARCLASAASAVLVGINAVPLTAKGLQDQNATTVASLDGRLRADGRHPEVAGRPPAQAERPAGGRRQPDRGPAAEPARRLRAEDGGRRQLAAPAPGQADRARRGHLRDPRLGPPRHLHRQGHDGAGQHRPVPPARARLRGLRRRVRDAQAGHVAGHVHRGRGKPGQAVPEHRRPGVHRRRDDAGGDRRAADPPAGDRPCAVRARPRAHRAAHRRPGRGQDAADRRPGQRHAGGARHDPPPAVRREHGRDGRRHGRRRPRRGRGRDRRLPADPDRPRPARRTATPASA